MKCRTLLLFLVTLPFIPLSQALAKELSQNYVDFMVCVDVEATDSKYKGNDTDTALRSGIARCEEELDRYAEELVNNTKRRNGWFSVQPGVRTSIRKNVIKNTISTMAPAYNAYKTK